MNFPVKKMSAVAIGVALGLSTLVAHAEEQPILTSQGPKSGAVFTGGATINNGASYLDMIPAADAIDVIGTIKPDPADVGKTGSLILVVNVPGLGLFSRASGGIWIPLNLSDLNSLQYYKTKKLTSMEKVSVLEDLIGEDTNLTGLQFEVFLAYITEGDLQTLTYSVNPIKFSISNTPSGGCPVNTTAGAGTFNGKPICILSGSQRITTNTHLTANYAYFLNGAVFVGEQTPTANDNKITLTIDAGTTLVASNETKSFLTIDRSGRIMANGTAENPIIMTSEQDEDGADIDPLNLRGTWGGLIINGRAKLNTLSGTDTGEGGTGQYGGGSNPVNDDDSGSLTYLQIRYAGQVITEENELNSLALQGVGSGTNIDYVHIHNGADDGVEFYGGTVNARHLVITGVDDDAIDWTTGWSGNLQHAVVKLTTSGDNCIEADNLGSNPTATPRSIPTISNLTCVGNATGMKSNGHAFELKAGTGMKLYNSVIGGTFPLGGEGCIRISGADTFSLSGASIPTLNGTLIMENSLITTQCEADLKEGSGALWTTRNWYGAQLGSSAGSVDLGGYWGWANGWNINSVAVQMPVSPFFETVNYIGGIKDGSSDWTQGWTFDYEAE